MMTTEIFSRCEILEQLLLPQHTNKTTLSTPRAALPPGANLGSLDLIWPDTVSDVEESRREAVRAVGIFGDMQVTKSTKTLRSRDDDGLVNVKESKAYSLDVRGWAYRIEFCWRFDTLSPVSYSLSLRHYVSGETHPELVSKLRTTITRGDLRGLQQMLLAREVTPTSFVARMTLFEFAASMHEAEICRFLARQNLQQCLGEDLCRPVIGPDQVVSYTHPLRGTEFEKRSRLSNLDDVFLSMGIPATTRMQWLRYLRLERSHFFYYYHRIRASEVDNMEREALLNAAWDAATDAFRHDVVHGHLWIPGSQIMASWTSLFCALISEGVNIHRLCSTGGLPVEGDEFAWCTSLCVMLYSSKCQREVEYTMSCWLSVLNTAGVDMVEYLRWETAYCEHRFRHPNRVNFFGAWPQILGSKTICGFEVPIRRRWVDPDSPASEVRQEFRNFGSHEHPPVSIVHWPKETDEDIRRQHISWKTGSSRQPSRGDDWPYQYSAARDYDFDDISKSLYWIKNSADYRTSFNYAKRLFHERFERRQSKKLYKSGYLQKKKRLRIPGAWEESRW
ncbi:hypothetical protein CKAH01_02183 [Colletotrichum kahawae]|uniref:Uncharacterized protein n=1 Tax=Colletotrichum kahawae TaxID=34407 RepID=A0AAD9Y3T3_COLKA|nr:hypothetical protein CKAH01_02183 [Colletotrichum kahawae]